ALLEPALARAADGPGGALFARAPLVALAAVDWKTRLSREQAATLQRWAASLPAAELPAAAPAAKVAPSGDGDELSAREREVLALIANGDSNKVIARSLDLSPYTVKRHVANILDKLAVASRGQAAAWHRAQAS
ncbi:MAG TPA: helix-turn-helix transcriptional regulator, partial [Burkholderiaceae bacterium]|nr:helix-turn-helix transcriptional regulator [Burkholderiaceae bacterium]